MTYDELIAKLRPLALDKMELLDRLDKIKRYNGKGDTKTILELNTRIADIETKQDALLYNYMEG